MNWNVYYDDLVGREMDGDVFAGTQTINQIKSLNEENRIIFKEYEEIQIQNGITLKSYRQYRSSALNFLITPQINKINIKGVTKEHFKDHLMKMDEVKKNTFNGRIRYLNSFIFIRIKKNTCEI